MRFGGGFFRKAETPKFSERAAARRRLLPEGTEVVVGGVDSLDDRLPALLPPASERAALASFQIREPSRRSARLRSTSSGPPMPRTRPDSEGHPARFMQ
jgi:hypothetical protein